MNWTTNNNSFQLDDRSTLELQNFVLQFAANLKLEGSQEIKNWQKYLLKDVSFRLAYLLSVNHINDNNLEAHLLFIKETQEYLSSLVKQHQEAPLYRKIQKDFEDLIAKFLSKKKDIEDLKDFFQHLKVNLLDTYQKSLTAKADHSPDIGLLFTFIQLFRAYLLPDINNLPQRLTQFYYESIIGKKRFSPLPDITHVFFEPAKFVNQSTVKKGIPLFAGKDANLNNILFETQSEVQLSQAKLLDIRTLYFSTPNSEVTQGIFKRHSYTGDIFVDFETFGKNIALYNEPAKEDIAEFGFAVASKLLYLKEGERIITLGIPLPDESFKKWEKAFSENCYFEITTRTGWVRIDSFKINSFNNYIDIKLEFPIEFDPIEAFNDFGDLPAISCMVKGNKDGNRVESFNNFQNFQINPKSIDLIVEVKGIKDLTCYNDLGILNISQPFQPFGTTPTKYSKFVIGNPEVFQKNLEEVTLYLDWNLPDWDFENYFNAYRNDVSDLEEYKVKFNASKQKEGIQLFGGRGENGEHSFFKIPIEIPYNGPDDWSSELPEYRKDTKWGYLEMQLISPPYPFGTGLYQQVLASQIRKKENEVNYSINPPMIPELGGIQLSYKSKLIENERDRDHQFYHIHPFGKELVESKNCSLITRKYEDKDSGKNYHGLLFLGIDHLTHGILSIYFELAGSSLIPSNSETNITPPLFFLVCDNQFIPITKVSDTTEGFEQSGIIQLNIESSFPLDSKNTILSPDLHWIAVIAKENVESFGLTKRINLHGTTAIRTSDIIQYYGENEVSLKSGAIIRTLDDVPAIRQVIQPSSSFSGRAREEASSYSKRISSEIRHRHRPSKRKDIEAIIYGEFPQIHQCRVFSEYNQINVVIVPFKQSNILRPAFAISFLRKVKIFVEKLVSPFLIVVVENPHYAVLQTNSYLRVNSNNSVLNLDQLSFQVKQKLLKNYLNPWVQDSYLIGETPNFTQLKTQVEKSFKQVSVEGFVFYYYYYSAKNISFSHYFFSNRKNIISSKKVIFLPDENINFHNINYGGSEEFKKETDKTGDIKPEGFYFTPTYKSI